MEEEVESGKKDEKNKLERATLIIECLSYRRRFSMKALRMNLNQAINLCSPYCNEPPTLDGERDT